MSEYLNSFQTFQRLQENIRLLAEPSSQLREPDGRTSSSLPLAALAYPGLPSE